MMEVGGVVARFIHVKGFCIAIPSSSMVLCSYKPLLCSTSSSISIKKNYDPVFWGRGFDPTMPYPPSLSEG